MKESFERNPRNYPDERIKEESAPNLSQRIQQIAENPPDNIDCCTQFASGKFKCFWQAEQYGPELEKKSDDVFRGYFMTEIEDIPELVHILREVAIERKQIGKSFEFKWLLASNCLTSPEFKKDNYYGIYHNSKETDPSAVIYADTAEEIQETIRFVTQNTRWKDRMKRMSDERSRPLIKHRRPGTNAYIDETGYEWRGICYNNKPGYSESEAKDPNWRENKQGEGSTTLD